MKAAPSLAVGSRLGPYQIRALIGAGGMGEVYRALDTRLGREVAVKVMSPQSGSQPERLKRFEDEARAASALNHPNIVATYDVGAEEGVAYCVSELLRGETLRKVLSQGALPERKALTYALQAALGLGAAHEAGIVHRDLKPENLFVTEDGQLKILDFGLAKWAGTRDEPRAGSDSQVATLRDETAPGTVMGTAGYMSPEQVRGKPVDHRSDLFSLGAVLHEMLSGQKAFGGDSVVESMSAILKEEPRDLAGVSPVLSRIVRRCLEKSVAQRFQSARDLAFQLETVLSIPTSSGSGASATAAAATTGSASSAGAPASRSFPWRALAIAATAAAVSLAFYSVHLASRPATVPVFQRLTFRPGLIGKGVVGPDGKTVLFGAAWDGKPYEVFSTRLGSPEFRSLDLEGALPLAVSADGELALKKANGRGDPGTLAQVSLAGGVPREIATDVVSAAFRPDGKELALIRKVKGGSQVEMPPGQRIYGVSEPQFLWGASISPSGTLAFLCGRYVGPNNHGRVMVSERGRDVRALTDEWIGQVGLAWSPDGREVWFNGTKDGNSPPALLAVDLRGRVRTLLTTHTSLVLEDVRGDVTLASILDQRQSMLCLAPGQAQERDLSWLDYSVPAAFSDDGNLVVFGESRAGGGVHGSIYLRRTDGSPAVRLGDGIPAALSPDGRFVLALTDALPPEVLLVPTSAGATRRWPAQKLNIGRVRFFADGRRLLLEAGEVGKARTLWIQDLDEDLLPRGVARPLGTQPTAFAVPSPDGKTVAAILASRSAILLPVDDPSPDGIAEIKGFQKEDLLIGWDSTGRSLYVHRQEGASAVIHLLDPVRGERSLFRRIPLGASRPVGALGALFLSADGASHVYGYRSSSSDLYRITGLR